MANEVNGIPVLHKTGPYGVAVASSGNDYLVNHRPHYGSQGTFNWIPDPIANVDLENAVDWEPFAASVPFSFDFVWTELSNDPNGSHSNVSGQTIPDGSTYAYYIDKNNTGLWSVVADLNVSGAGNLTRGGIAFWFKGSTASASRIDFFSVGEASPSTENFRLYINSSSLVEIGFWSGAQIHSVATVDSDWHYYQVRWEFSGTAQELRVRIDDTDYGPFNYTAASGSSFDEVTCGMRTAGASSSASTADFYYGPVYWTRRYLFPGKLRIENLDPDSDVDSTWTPTGAATRWGALGGQADWDNDSTYISSTTTGQVQNVTLENLPTLSSSERVRGVQIRAAFSSANGTTIQLKTSDLVSAGTLTSSTNNIEQSSFFNLDGKNAFWNETKINGSRLTITKDASATSRRVYGAYATVAIDTNFGGSTVQQSLSGVLSFTSAQLRLVKDTLTAGLSFTSAQTRLVKDTLTAGLSFASDQTRKALKALTGGLLFSGAITTYAVFRQALTATLSFLSTQQRLMKKSLDASLSPVSDQTKKVTDTLSATLSFTGALTPFAAVRLALTAALSFASDQTRKITNPLSAALSFTSDQTRLVKDTLSAALSFTSAQTRLPVYQLVFNAVLSFTSSSAVGIKKVLSAALDFAGNWSIPPRRYGGVPGGGDRGTEGTPSGGTRGTAGSAGPGTGRQ